MRVSHVIAPGHVLLLGLEQFLDRPFIPENGTVFGKTLVLGHLLRFGTHQVHRVRVCLYKTMSTNRCRTRIDPREQTPIRNLTRNVFNRLYGYKEIKLRKSMTNQQVNCLIYGTHGS